MIVCDAFAALPEMMAGASDKMAKQHELVSAFYISRARGLNERDSMFWCNSIDQALLVSRCRVTAL